VARAQDNELVGTLAHFLFLGRTLAWDAEFEKKVMALDGAQIRAALKRHLDPSKFTIVKAGDFAGAAKKQPRHRRPRPNKSSQRPGVLQTSGRLR
jgi:zinc protease